MLLGGWKYGGPRLFALLRAVLVDGVALVRSALTLTALYQDMWLTFKVNSRFVENVMLFRAEIYCVT